MASGRTRGTVKPVGGRGSAEAIEKRRVARQLNTLFLGRDARGKVDGRTEKRRQRLLKEARCAVGSRPRQAGEQGTGRGGEIVIAGRRGRRQHYIDKKLQGA